MPQVAQKHESTRRHNKGEERFPLATAAVGRSPPSLFLLARSPLIAMEEACTLVRRLEQKYLDDDDAIVEDLLLTSFTGCSPCKMASQRALELLVLNNMNIQSIGDSSKLANLAAHVLEADLGWNQIHLWSDVSTILNNLPHLRVLNIGHNPLSETIDVELPEVPHLQTLILNGTNLRPSTLKDFLSKTPNLSELHLSDNQFTTDENDDQENEPISSFVRTVHLNRCGFEDWKSVAKLLKRFPMITSVFLCENPIRAIDQGASTDGMTSLKSLNLAKTELNDWSSLDNLNKLPSLTELRMPNIPLLESYNEEERRHLTIGRMQQLRVLNGSKISPEQREQSERFFIRYYKDLEDKPPQYKLLVERHGQLEQLINIDLSPKIFAVVKVLCEEANYETQMRVNLNKNIGDFMRFMEKRSGIKYARMRMFLMTSDGMIEECLLHNMPLHSLRVEDGDVFSIQSKLIISRNRRRPLERSQ
ncbi:unnamed protein product [Caenorhabditis auriculariae]|uniref:Tubulin-specific chaperone cofactor E-like protein n=1 Tax=Caenorhabditis auriculariae TaxID=2777116 RepID=A0A8S1GYF1_9PELO|nr:unnamed protein product [Caenorhabditis auriculariae]